MKHFKFLEKPKRAPDYEKKLESSAVIANLRRRLRSPLSGESFHLVDRSFKAHLNVYFTDKEYDADILVYVSCYPFRSKGRDEVWHYSEEEYCADTMIYPVEKPYLADLRVCLVDNEYQARWLRKRRLRTRKKQFT